jgi:hypothetical protein
MWVWTVLQDKNSSAAMPGLDCPAATRYAILVSVRVRASHPVAGRARTRRTAAADAAGLQPGAGAADVPLRAQRLIAADGFVEGGPGGLGVTPPGQQHRGVFQRQGAVEGPAGGLVVAGRGQHRGRVGLDQPAAMIGGRGPDRQRLAFCFGRRGLRGSFGGGGIPGGQGQPHQRRQQRVSVQQVLGEAGFQAPRELGDRLGGPALLLGGQRPRQQQDRIVPVDSIADLHVRHGGKVLLRGVPVIAVSGDQRDVPVHSAKAYYRPALERQVHEPPSQVRPAARTG